MENRGKSDQLVELIRGLQNLAQRVALIVTDEAERTRTQLILEEIIERVASTTGTDFFRALVRYLTRALDMDHALVAEIPENQNDQIRVVAVARRGELANNFELDLKDTAARETLQQGVAVYVDNVRERFPHDPLLNRLEARSFQGIPLFDSRRQLVGLIALIGSGPLSDPAMAESVLRLFALRAGSELERRRTVQFLRQSEERFRQMAENIGEVVWLTDASFKEVFYVSPAYERIWGQKRQSLYGRPASFFEPIVDEDRERISRAISSGKKLNEEFRIRRPDGCLAYILARTFPIREPAGEIRKVVGIAHDITDRKQMEEKLSKWQKIEATGRLAGGIAHDFNNILTIIAGHGQFLREAAGENDQIRNHVDAILASAEQAAELTHQLLAFGRRQILDPKLVNLNDIVTEMQRMLQSVLSENIKFSTSLHPDLGAVKVDPGQIKQVVVNLAINARDAMPEGGNLTIETANVNIDDKQAQRLSPMESGPFVMLVVRDTGHGMDQETQERIFEPFFTTKEMGKGSGLGLAMVYGTVKQSGGFIFAESTPGEGTTFRIYFPRIETRFRDFNRQAGEAAGAGGSETILVVEDDQGIRELIRQVLGKVGYRVLAAPHGTGALALSSNHAESIDLLLTDIVMPEMSGHELARRLLESRPRMKVLFMSGHTDSATSIQTDAGGKFTFLPKPFAPGTLLAKVRLALDS